MKIFLTGGSGFIGSWVVKTLLDQGHNLKVLVRNPQKLSILYSLENVAVIEGDLLESHVIDKALVGMDACIHIALGWGNEPLSMLENDTKASINLLQLSAKHQLKHFIYTSSTAAIGEIRPIMDEDISCRPIDLYGATKAAAESFILGYGKQSKMNCNIVRPGYTFGNPAFIGGGTQPDKRFSEIIRKAKINETISLIKHDGTQFIEAADLAKIYAAILESNADRQIYHGLSTEFISWENVAKTAIELCNSQSYIKLEDLGWSATPCKFGVSQIEKQFNLCFHSEAAIKSHLVYFRDLS